MNSSDRRSRSPLVPAPFLRRILRRALFRLLHRWRAPHRVGVLIDRVQVGLFSNSRLAEEIYANAFERREREILSRLIQADDVVLDIGANIGFYTCLFAATVGPNGRVVAFEPTPATHEQLRQNIALNGFSNVEIHEVALADEEGVASFNVFPEGSDAYNSLRAASTWGQQRAGVLTVKTDRLDNFANDLSGANVSVAKIDVEGAEELVISGARQFLTSLEKTILMVELNNEAARQFDSSIYRIADLLKGFGYDGFLLDGRGSLAPIDAEGLRILETMEARHFDVFFAKPSGVSILRSHGLI